MKRRELLKSLSASIAAMPFVGLLNFTSAKDVLPEDNGPSSHLRQGPSSHFRQGPSSHLRQGPYSHLMDYQKHWLLSSPHPPIKLDSIIYPVTMGVDPWHTYVYYTVRESDGCTFREKLPVKSSADLRDKMRFLIKYNKVDLCVMDSNPFPCVTSWLAKEFCGRFIRCLPSNYLKPVLNYNRETGILRMQPRFWSPPKYDNPEFAYSDAFCNIASEIMEKGLPHETPSDAAYFSRQRHTTV